MANMLPADPRDAVQSEIDVFEAIREGLDDSWTAIHSLGMAHHPDKPWTEIDFVLIGPEGLFCLEVKGGVEIARRGTKWLYRDRRGRTVVRDEGPFDQVGSAAAALRQYLLGQDASLSQMLVGYAVATPYVDFAASGPGIIPELVYDADDVDRPFHAFMRSVAGYWTARLAWRQTRPLERAGRKNLVDRLAGDFQLTRSLPGRISDVGRSLIRLTDEQGRVLEGSENDRLLVRGGAGTGKTLLAVRGAVASAEQGRRTLLTCFSRRLGDWLAAETSGVDPLTVVSMHKFMHDVIESTGRLPDLPPAEENHIFQVEYPRLAMEAMLDLGLTGSFDRLVVDEAQDLMVPGYLDVFDQMLDGGLAKGKWTMFYDPNQDLFRQLTGSGLCRINNLEPARYRLTRNCRNTRQVAFTAHMLAQLGPTETFDVDGPAVETLWYQDEADQRRVVGLAVGRLLSQGVAPPQIMVLSPRRLARSSLFGGLETVPFPLSDRAPVPAGAMGYSTIHGFKGMEADVVVVVDLPGLETREDRYLAYVAATRARAQLLVALPESARKQYDEAARIMGSRLRPPSSADP